MSDRDFLRIHRGHAVRLECVAGMRYYAAGAYTLELNDKAATHLPVSRKFARELRARLGVDRGVDSSVSGSAADIESTE